MTIIERIESFETRLDGIVHSLEFAVSVRGAYPLLHDGARRYQALDHALRRASSPSQWDHLAERYELLFDRRISFNHPNGVEEGS